MAECEETMITWDEAMSCAEKSARELDRTYTESGRQMSAIAVHAWVSVAREIREKENPPPPYQPSVDYR